MQVRGPASQSSKSNKGVNNLLHTLRGEHFRRTLNTQRTTRLGAAALSTPQLIGRSLPYAEIYDGLQPHRLSSRALGVDVKVTRTTVAGPIPRSWAAASTRTVKVSESESENPAWRATALSLFFAQSDSDSSESHLTRQSHGARSLVECCLRVLLEQYCASSSDSDVSTLEELASFMAPHHRKEAVRMCAVRNPLSGARLRAFLGEGPGRPGLGQAGGARRNHWHVEGELVVVQPASSLRPEMFRAHTRVNGRRHQHESGSEEQEPWQWDRGDLPVDVGSEADHHSGSGPTVTDAESDWQEQELEQGQEPFTAVAIVSTSLSIAVILALPSSLTRLALVHLSAPIPIHRLPDKCPLLELLDISYNPWLAEPAWGGERALERVEWGRWAYLKVLGCRDCGVTLEELTKVNEWRWEDVRIVT